MRTRRWRHLVRVGALLGVLILLATACGNDDDGGASESSSTTDPAAALSGEPIRLMVIFEGTGVSAIPTTPDGAIAAADAVNRDGGIDGRPVEVVECDTGNDPNTAAECGRRIVDEGFLAAVGSLSLQTSEYLPQLAQAKIPSVGQAPTTADTFTSEASFPIQGAAVSSIAGLAGALADMGSTNIGLARPDLAAGGAIAGIANTGLERFGIEIGNDVPVPEGAPDMAPFVEAALKGGTDGVLVTLAGPEAASFLTELRATDPDVPVAVVTTFSDEVFKSLGDATEGLILQTQFLEPDFSDAPGVQELTDDMEAAGFEDFSGPRPPNSWSAVMIVAEVLRDAAEITPQALWDELGSGREFETGLTPPVQFATPSGSFPRIFNACLIITTIENGEPVPVTGEFQDAITGEPCEQP